ncbi:MAG: Nudix family hydrolase [Gammaproteobacteria bacterium]|nr:Nudix family hydrolase [Gammaproteobacteria bacterium]
MTEKSRKLLDVAVGVIQQSNGRILLAQRPEGKPMSGYWEFPGGKIEPGEAPVRALARELHEELGIDIAHALPWITREYQYPHATARLHMFHITQWKGEPHGREGQQLSWQDPHAVDIEPLLPANHGILKALQLPRVYAITKAAKFGTKAFMERLQAALENGVRLIQVREKDMTPQQLRTFTTDVIAMAHQYKARVLVNGDRELAIETGADGVHLQTSQFMQLENKPDTKLWAASCHNREELLHAAALEANFAVLSPVLPTQTHPGAPTLGWEGFAEQCADLPMPVFALGGMKLDLLDTARAHNAHGIALLSGIW